MEGFNMEGFNTIISSQRASQLLQISEGAVKNRCSRGKLLGKKVGKMWLLDSKYLFDTELIIQGDTTYLVRSESISIVCEDIHKIYKTYKIDDEYVQRFLLVNKENVIQKVFANLDDTVFWVKQQQLNNEEEAHIVSEIRKL